MPKYIILNGKVNNIKRQSNIYYFEKLKNMCWLFIYSRRYGLRTVPLKQHIINTIQPLARYGSETVPPVNVFY